MARKRPKSEVRPVGSGQNLPKVALDSVVWDVILKHLDYETLKICRLVSRSWNKRAMHYMRIRTVLKLSQETINGRPPLLPLLENAPEDERPWKFLDVLSSERETLDMALEIKSLDIGIRQLQIRLDDSSSWDSGINLIILAAATETLEVLEVVVNDISVYHYNSEPRKLEFKQLKTLRIVPSSTYVDQNLSDDQKQTMLAFLTVLSPTVVLLDLQCCTRLVYVEGFPIFPVLKTVHFTHASDIVGWDDVFKYTPSLERMSSGNTPLD